jgi:hypothetical protein
VDVKTIVKITTNVNKNENAQKKSLFVDSIFYKKKSMPTYLTHKCTLL